MIITHIPDNFRSLGIELPDPAQAIGMHFPDYLIIGPWRTGTTWLSEMIKCHPDLFMTDVKETHYFFNLESKKQTYAPKDFLWYLDLFDPVKHPMAGSRLKGEASATYATELSPDMIRFIYTVNPQIKIVFGVRDPVARAWSHAKMNLLLEAADYAHLSMDEQYEKVLRKHYILDAGHYHRHIEKWLSVIPESQFYLFEFERLTIDPAFLFSELCGFLGVDRGLDRISESVKRVGVVAETPGQDIPVHIARRLGEFYMPEIRILADRYNIHFSSELVSNVNPLILLNHHTPGYSETFIANHILHLHAQTINLRQYLPLSIREAESGTHLILDRLRLWLNARRLQKHLQRAQKPILIEYGTTAAKALPALRRLNGRIIIHFHGYDAHRKSIIEAHRQAYRELFQIATAIVVVSRKMRETIVNLGAPPEKVHHIVCGVDPRYFVPADVRASAPVFFACGRFVEKKAPHLTIMAFHRAWQQIPQIRLRMAGDGPLLKPCQDLVGSLHLEKCVDFLGVIDPSQVSSELRIARAFIQHSITASDGDSEGTPVGILEAGCSAVPVISTRHAGIMDVVLEEQTGLLCDEGNVGAMAAAIIRLAKDPEEAARMGVNAHTHIMRNYTMAGTISQLRNLLSEA